MEEIVETVLVLCSTLAQVKTVRCTLYVFWGSLLHNLRLSAVANFLLPRFDQAMNPSAPSFKPAGGVPTPAIEGPTAAGTTNVDASLAIVPPRERQAGVVDHRVTSEALARLGAVNTPVPVDRMSTTSAVNSDEAMPYGPTLNLGFSQYNTQQNLHVSLDRSAEVAAVAEARHAELMTKKDALFMERLGAIQANAQAEYARLGKELDVSNQTIINQQREFAARMGFGQQQLDEAITTAIQAQKQNHDLQVNLVKAQARAEEESAKSDAIRRHMEAEARAKDESVQKELDSMRQALEDMRAQMLTAPGGELPVHSNQTWSTLLQLSWVRAPGGKLQVLPKEECLRQRFQLFPSLHLLVWVLSIKTVGLLMMMMMIVIRTSTRKIRSPRRTRKGERRRSVILLHPLRHRTPHKWESKCLKPS